MIKIKCPFFSLQQKGIKLIDAKAFGMLETTEG